MTVKHRRLLVASDVDLGPARAVHCLHEPHHVYIGRQSKWSNPFRIGRNGTRMQVILRYERYLSQCPWLLEDLHELQGLVLGCWCSPHPCHGEVLVRMANEALGADRAPEDDVVLRAGTRLVETRQARTGG